MSIRIVVTALALTAAAAAGCHRPQGALMSHTGESRTFFSYETRQASITLRDLRNDEVIFRLDVPPGQQLTLQFYPGEGDDPVYTPDMMRYQLWPIGTTTGRLRNALTVPAAWSRRIDVEYREGVEFMQPPPGQELRADEAANRPDWWTPRGGPIPEDERGKKKYDG